MQVYIQYVHIFCNKCYRVDIEKSIDITNWFNNHQHYKDDQIKIDWRLVDNNSTVLKYVKDVMLRPKLLPILYLDHCSDLITACIAHSR